MKQSETIAVPLSRESCMVLTENNNGLYPANNDPMSLKTPRVVITTASYGEEGVFYHAESVTLYNEAVKKLHAALKSYFQSDDVNALVGGMGEAIEVIKHLVPPRNCSCHISAPCGQCEQYGEAYAFLDEWKTKKP